MLSNARQDRAEQSCDWCYQRKGRNKMIIHQLSFTDEDAFRRHLQQLYGAEGEKDGWIDSRINFYRFVHRYYWQAAKDKYQPLALTYLEATGARIGNRAEWIMRHRGRTGARASE